MFEVLVAFTTYYVDYAVVHSEGALADYCSAASANGWLILRIRALEARWQGTYE